jgi:hypothetical protein
LLAQVRVLAARHFVLVHVGGSGAHVAFERLVEAPHGFPIPRDLRDRIRIETRVARAVAQRRGDRAEIGLRGQAAHRIDRGVDGIDAGFDRGEHARAAVAARIVGVESGSECRSRL